MKKLLFEGLCTALITPFKDGKINFPMVTELIHRQIDAGVHAIVLSGTTGESPTLSDDEKLELFRCGVNAADGACCMIAGTGSNDTAHAIALSRQVQNIGVDGCLVVTPYYNKTTQHGLVKHYQAIAAAVDLPVIVYHVPSRTGMDLTMETCRQLSKIPNIAGIKEASGNISRIAHIISENGNELPVWSGNDDQTVPVMALGGRGVISVASNVMPNEMNEMVIAALRGDFKTAARLQCKLLPLMDLLFSRVSPIPVKAAMKYVGYDVGTGRMPLEPADDALEHQLKSFFFGGRMILDGSSD